METKHPVPRAILVGNQLDGIDDVAHEASLDELGRLVETLGYEVAGSVSQKRDGIGGLTVLGKGKLAELAAITGGTAVVGGWTAPQKSKARERFENAEATTPDTREPEPDGAPRPEFVIVDHEISPSQARISRTPPVRRSSTGRALSWKSFIAMPAAEKPSCRSRWHA
jgi:GTPase